MSGEAEAIQAPPAVSPMQPGRPWSRRAAHFLREQPLGTAGLAIFVLLIVVAALADVIATHDPISQDHMNRFASPSSDHWFGTDNFGRDLFSRIVHGARTSLFVGVSTVALGTTLGALLGLVSAYYARVDMIVQRVVDAVLALPLIILALAVVAALGQSLRNTVIAIAIAFVPAAARVIRSQALSVQQRPFVEAARSAGAGDLRVLLRHVAPNCFAPYIILASTALAAAIIVEASLSFLNLGTPPPEPSWGQMLSGQVQQYANRAPWLAFFPGMAIFVTVLGISLFGDALRDVLDPRLRGSR